MKFQDDDGPGDIKLTAWEENLGWCRAEPMDCVKWHRGCFMGRGKGGTRGGTSLGRQKEKRENVLAVCRQ